MTGLKILLELPYSCYLYGVIFIVFPILALFLRQYYGAERMMRYTKIACPFAIVYLMAFYFGYSFYGDYVDYSILGLYYLWLCLFLFSSTIYKSWVLKVIGAVGCISVGLMGIFCFLSFPFFIYASQDFECDRKFIFKDKRENKYEVRRYTFGGALSSNTRYTFKTYRVFDFVPFEKQIDITDFFDDATNLEISDSMTFSISTSLNGHLLQFSDKNGKNYIKQIR